jgi:CheY-like chemotaxis protein
MPRWSISPSWSSANASHAHPRGPSNLEQCHVNFAEGCHPLYCGYIDEQELLIIGKCGYSESSQRSPVCGCSSRSPYGRNWMATRRLRAIPELAQVPIVAVISYLLSGDEAKTREAGCNRYIPKPSAQTSYSPTVRLGPSIGVKLSSKKRPVVLNLLLRSRRHRRLACEQDGAGSCAQCSSTLRSARPRGFPWRTARLVPPRRNVH